MTIFETLFSFAGRVGRARYWAAVSGLALFMAAMAVVVRILVPAVGLEIHPTVRELLAITISLPLLIAILAIQTKRFHDFNFRGWWMLVALVLAAFAGSGWDLIKHDVSAWFGYAWESPTGRRLTDALLLMYLTLLGAIPGSRGPNRYGAVPSGRKQSALSQP